MSHARDYKKDFPILARTIHGKPLAYLDSAATTQKPQVFIDALQEYYTTTNANIHRGVHTLSEEATLAYDTTRHMVAEFLGASSEEIIMTKNVTEGINLIAYTWAEDNIHEGDEIVVSAMEHHANLVPWQECARRKGATLKVAPLHPDLTLDIEAYKKLLSEKTKLVCMTGMSNVTGIRTPLKEVIDAAHAVGAKVMVDGAQLAAHAKVDLHILDADFFVCSAHKMLGPMGVGSLYVKKEIMAEMRPWIFGGDMIERVEQYYASYKEGPQRFEAGTPNIADIVAFQVSLRYLSEIGMDVVAAHDREMGEYARERFAQYRDQGVSLIGAEDINNQGGIVAFTIEGIHPHDIATIFDHEGVAVRAGFHCAQSFVTDIHPTGVVRMSFHIYTTKEDIDRAEVALQKVLTTLGR